MLRVRNCAAGTIVGLAFVGQGLTIRPESKSRITLNSSVGVSDTACRQLLEQSPYDCKAHWKGMSSGLKSAHNGFPVGSEELRALQDQFSAQALALTKHLYSHGIAPVAAQGTLLAVVRDHGCWIPWDDDMDLSVSTDEFKTLFAFVESCADSDYKWDSNWRFKECMSDGVEWLVAVNTPANDFLKFKFKSAPPTPDLGGIDISSKNLGRHGTVLRRFDNQCILAPDEDEAAEWLQQQYGAKWSLWPAGTEAKSAKLEQIATGNLGPDRSPSKVEISATKYQITAEPHRGV